MAVPEVKHNGGEKLNVENLRATLGNRPAPHRLFIDPTLLFEGACFGVQTEAAVGALPRDQFENRVDHHHCGLGHHPSLAIKENGITVSRFRLCVAAIDETML